MRQAWLSPDIHQMALQSQFSSGLPCVVVWPYPTAVSWQCLRVTFCSSACQGFSCLGVRISTSLQGVSPYPVQGVLVALCLKSLLPSLRKQILRVECKLLIWEGNSRQEREGHW